MSALRALEPLRVPSVTARCIYRVWSPEEGDVAQRFLSPPTGLEAAMAATRRTCLV